MNNSDKDRLYEHNLNIILTDTYYSGYHNQVLFDSSEALLSFEDHIHISCDEFVSDEGKVARI